MNRPVGLVLYFWQRRNICCRIKWDSVTKYLTKSTRTWIFWIITVCAYLPVYRDGEDGLDVGQHCFELLRILFESHFCQYKGLANILDRNTTQRKKNLFERFLLWCWLHLVDMLTTAGSKPDTFINIHLLVQTLWWGHHCRTLLSLSVLCTFCPQCSCRQSQTLSETNEQHRKQQRFMWEENPSVKQAKIV